MSSRASGKSSPKFKNAIINAIKTAQWPTMGGKNRRLSDALADMKAVNEILYRYVAKALKVKDPSLDDGGSGRRGGGG